MKDESDALRRRLIAGVFFIHRSKPGAKNGRPDSVA